MNLEAARAALARTGTDLNAARTVLIDFGTESVGPGSGARSLADLIRIAANAPPSRARRDFAVLLVHALGVDGLLSNRGEAADALRSFIERALLNALRRAGYPFDGTAYDKRHALAGLHATIEEHLRPLEPSIPRWLHGVVRPDED